MASAGAFHVIHMDSAAIDSGQCLFAKAKLIYGIGMQADGEVIGICGP